MSETRIQLINTGYFHADGGAMFGATPRQAWNKRYPFDALNRCLLAMRVGLVVTRSGRTILIDSGVGDKQLARLKNTSYHFSGLADLCDALRSRGLTADAVTDVVLTHLHFDHCGYVTRYVNGVATPVFPNAACWVSRAQWNNSLNPHPLEADAYFRENMDAIAQSGKLQLIDSDCNLCPDVHLRLYDGHTCRQIVPCVRQTGRTVVFAGDVIPLSAQVSPSWISAYDTHPLVSYHEKIRLLEEAAAEKQVVVYYHDAGTPCSTVEKINNFFRAIRMDSLS